MPISDCSDDHGRTLDLIVIFVPSDYLIFFQFFLCWLIEPFWCYIFCPRYPSHLFVSLDAHLVAMVQ